MDCIQFGVLKYYIFIFVVLKSNNDSPAISYYFYYRLQPQAKTTTIHTALVSYVQFCAFCTKILKSTTVATLSAFYSSSFVLKILTNHHMIMADTSVSECNSVCVLLVSDLLLMHHLVKSLFTLSGMFTFTVKILRLSPRLIASVCTYMHA